MNLNPIDHFAPRHIGPTPDETRSMLATIGAGSLDALIDEAIPASIRLKKPLNLPDGESESAYLTRLAAVARRNRVGRSLIGLGYYDTLTPGVIRRLCRAGSSGNEFLQQRATVTGVAEDIYGDTN